jgi:hypothetical protein
MTMGLVFTALAVVVACVSEPRPATPLERAKMAATLACEGEGISQDPDKAASVVLPITDEANRLGHGSADPEKSLPATIKRLQRRLTTGAEYKADPSWRDVERRADLYRLGEAVEQLRRVYPEALTPDPAMPGGYALNEDKARQRGEQLSAWAKGYIQKMQGCLEALKLVELESRRERDASLGIGTKGIPSGGR